MDLLQDVKLEAEDVELIIIPGMGASNPRWTDTVRARRSIC